MNHRVISFLVGVVIIAFVVGGVVYWEWPQTGPTVGPPPAEAEPVITWTPASVTEIISPGETKTVTASFIASESVSDVVLRVVPALQPFVQMSPSAFVSITPEQVVAINVTFSAPANSSIAKLDGTLQLRGAIGSGKTLSKPLPVVLHIGRVFTDPVAGYELTYDPRFEINDLRSTRPTFIGGKLFSMPGDMPNLAIATYDNPLGLSVKDWYAKTLADKEYTLSDAGARTTASLIVAGTLVLQVRSEVLGYVQLRTFMPHGNKVIGLETTVPDDVDVPESYFLMLATFSFIP